MRNLKHCGYHFFVVNGLPWLHFEDAFLPIRLICEPTQETLTGTLLLGYLVLFRGKINAPPGGGGGGGWERAFGNWGAGDCVLLCGSGGTPLESPRRAPQGGCSGFPPALPPAPSSRLRTEGTEGAAKKKEVVALQGWLAIAASSTSNLKSAWNFSVEVIGVTCRNSFHGPVGEHREMTGQFKSWVSVFLLQTNFSLNGHKTVMYGLMSDNLWTPNISPKCHAEGSPFFTVKKGNSNPNF